MCVPEEVRKIVVYLARLVDEGSQRRLHFCGTGFVVIVDSAKDYGQKRQYLHLVTARPVCCRDRLESVRTPWPSADVYIATFLGFIVGNSLPKIRGGWIAASETRNWFGWHLSPRATAEVAHF